MYILITNTKSIKVRYRGDRIMANKKISLSDRHQKLYNELKKEVKKANQRLVRIERETGKNSWAGKRLESKLDSYLNAWTETGRIRINKSMSMTKLHAIKKATKQFIDSQTSTVGGIKRTIKNQKQGMKQSLSREYGDTVEELSDEEVEALYDMFSDDYAIDVMQFIPSSDIWQLIIDAKENRDTKTQFLERISTYLDYGNDVDMKKKILHIYTKFVK